MRRTRSSQKTDLGSNMIVKMIKPNPAKYVKESEKRFRKLFDSANDIIVIFDKLGRVIDVNKGGCRLLGYSKKKIISMGVRGILPEDRRRVWHEHIRNLWRKNEARWEGKGLTVDGKIILIDFHSVKAKYDDTEVLLCIGRDVTLNKLLEDELKIKSDAIASSITPIAISSAKGYLTYANRAFIRTWGYSSEDEVKKVHASNFWADRDGIYKIMSSPLKGGSWSGELLAKKKNGKTFWAQSTFSAVKGVSGNPNVIIGSFKDIAIRKQAEEVLRRDKAMIESLVKEKTRQLVEAKEKLARAKRLTDLGMMATTVAHELRNPLSVMQVAILNILKKSREKRIKMNLIRLQNNIAESEMIIKRMLTYTKARMIVPAKLDFREFMNERIADLTAKYSRRKLRITTDLADQMIKADPVQIKELLVNIFDNSMQSFEGRKGKIKITARPTTLGKFLISIEDNGSGIDKKDVPHLFEPFFTRRPAGTGLGLPICKEIVELHGGDIKVASEKNKGTKVSIFLPRKCLISRKMSV